MSSPAPGSSAFADPPAGTVIAGFRLDRVIGRGSRATVYEATQLSLDRRVAFKLLHDRALADRVRRLTWPEHRGAVSLFAAGDSDDGPWLAMRLVPGGTLERRRAPLHDVTAALDLAHAAGLVHGDVTARNVLVEDGRAFLSDFGLGPEDATAEDDRAAFAQLVREHPPPPPRGRRRAVRAAAGVGGAVAVAVAVGIALAGGDEDSAAAPPAPAGTRSVGSDLAAGDVESVDCDGRPPGGASRACTISQWRLGGREVVAPVDGAITSWAVRGAKGTLALQVLRGRGGRLVQLDRSVDEMVPGPGVHVARSDLPVAAGDRIGLAVSPGATVGVRPAGPGAALQRWFGPLLEPPRRPERPAGSRLDDELLLRVDIRRGPVPHIETRPGARDATDVQLRGTAAATAPGGQQLAFHEVDLGPGALRRVLVVALGRDVAVELVDGPARLVRVPLRGADARGRVVALSAAGHTVSVRWRNPDGREIERRYAVTAGGLNPADPSG